jgi:CheY-like chemotaxis protein
MSNPADGSPEPALVGAESRRHSAVMAETAPIAVERRRQRKAGDLAVPRRAHGEGAQTVLVIEDDPIQRQHIAGMSEAFDARSIAVATGEEGLAALEQQRFDCVVIDLGLPGMSGWDVIERIRSTPALSSTPLIVYTARDLTRKEEFRLGKATKSVIIKEVRSAERLQEEIANLLLRPEAEQAFPGKHSTGDGHSDPVLSGRKVLVVDDDIRNIFALTAMLERQGMDAISVDNGKDAIRIAREDRDIAIALVDVMMPEMDGYATMRSLREIPFFKHRPIVALTAKAMKGDREKCIEAGASDYIAKPVESSNLLSMLRAWLSN